MYKFATIIIAISLGILMMFFVDTTNAQNPVPCTPDCEDTTWVHTSIPVNLRGCDQHCYVIIYYSYRIACGTYQDLQVTRIETQTTYCNNCSTKDLFLQAYYAVITINEMNFEPRVGEEGCNYVWRVSAGGCLASWLIYYHDPSHQGDTLRILQKCDGEETPCCLKNLRVCRFKREVPLPDSVTITPTAGDPYPAYTCAGDTIPKVDTLPQAPDSVQCEPVCDWFDDILFNSEKRSFYIETESMKTPLYPNPAHSKIGFDIEVREIGMLKTEIYSVEGQLVKTHATELGQGWNTIEIDIGELTPGQYNIITSINGTYLHTKKFIVKK